MGFYVKISEKDHAILRGKDHGNLAGPRQNLIWVFPRPGWKFLKKTMGF